MAAGDLTTLANVRSFLRLPTAQTDGDALLATFITAVSAAIRTYTGREFSATDTGSHTRLFRYFGGGMLFLDRSDLRSVSAVSIDTETSSSTALVLNEDYFLLPRGARDGVYEAVELRGYATGSHVGGNIKPWREVSITGLWGFSSVPKDVETAANMYVAHWMRNHSTVPGRDLAGEGDRFGAVNMPSGVMQLLAPYRVIAFGAGA